MSEFSNLLNRYIHQKGYSIRSLAKRAGIPVATLTKMCSGARSPRNQKDRIDRIADVLMLTPAQRQDLTDMLEKEIVGAVDPHNLEALRRIQPLLLDMSGRRDAYQAFYYYERTATLSASALQFPNVMISEQGVLLCAADYSHAIYSGSPQMQKYFQRLFRTQLAACRPLTRIFLSLREQIGRYISLMQAGDPRQPLLTLEWQPCLMWAVSEQEIQYFLPQNVPFRSEYLNLYLPYLRKIQQWDKALLFFSREGLEDFVQTGRILELPDDILDGPLPVSLRAELLRRMLEAARQGRVEPRIVREEKLRIGRDTQLISYGSDTVLLASMNHLAGNQACFIEELSANWSALDFLENLESTDWTLSAEESCVIIREVLDRCLQQVQDEPPQARSV